MGRRKKESPLLPDDTDWYRDAVIYELHVRAFHDADGDGIGDFRGLQQKLDYLNDLGVTAIWLLPFYPSPLKDDGYDISDYEAVNPVYGTLADFKSFLRAAHRRGIRVITELVINHTSDQHPWFQRARRVSPGDPWRDFYVWSDSPDRYRQARIIFKDFEASNWTYDPVAGAYYWHRFYSHQPDLNFDNPRVRQAVMKTLDFWLGMGVDGFRLDAIPYLFEREGTNCENLPETHDFLKEIRSHIDQKFANRMLLAEANQWPEDAVAYFGEGDECHMCYHFPLMPRMFMALRLEDRYPIIEIMEQTPSIPQGCQWAIFLRNHDELTLEMVTDEERDYMYRIYAADPRSRINMGIRRRLAPLMGNNRRKIELLNSLLFSLPGTPVIYYGDEIGMGDNIYLGDRDGVRTPLQWSADRNAGFSRANPQRLYLPIIIDPEYHYETVNVDSQQNNPSSLLWWMKRMIALRNRYRAFNRGRLEFLHPRNRKILAFIRTYEEERILVVANLSRYVEYAELELSTMAGMIPVELFSHSPFPPLGENPLFLTMGPNSFYWFLLEKPRHALAVRHGRGSVIIEKIPDLSDLFSARYQNHLVKSILPDYLRRHHWYESANGRIESLTVHDQIRIPLNGIEPLLLILKVAFTEGEPQNCLLAIALAEGERARCIGETNPDAIIVREKRGEESRLLYDALALPETGRYLLQSIPHRRQFRGKTGVLRCRPERKTAISHMLGKVGEEFRRLPEEHNSTSILYENKILLKYYRKPEWGVNPALEIGRYFRSATRFRRYPVISGSLSYIDSHGEITLALIREYVSEAETAWKYALDNVAAYFERVIAGMALPQTPKIEKPRAERYPPFAGADISAEIRGILAPYLHSCEILGRRTAEMHLALASRPDHPDFAHEPFSALYLRSLFQSLQSLTDRTLIRLKNRLSSLNPDHRKLARQIMDKRNDIIQCFRAETKKKYDLVRIRIHGDYHLVHLLHTGRDFIIINFEGEHERPISQRKLKRSPLKDVACMIRSFHYAALSALREIKENYPGEGFRIDPEWIDFWVHSVSDHFLKGYYKKAARAPFLPANQEEREGLLLIYSLEKALYEINYELSHRPEEVGIPLQGIKQLLEAVDERAAGT